MLVGVGVYVCVGVEVEVEEGEMVGDINLLDVTVVLFSDVDVI